MSTSHVRADRLGPSVIPRKRGRKVGTVRKAQWGWYPSGRCEVSRRDWQSRNSARSVWQPTARPGVAPGDSAKRLALRTSSDSYERAHAARACMQCSTSRLTCKRPRVLRECKSSRLAAGGWTPERDKRSRSASASGRRLKQSMTVVMASDHVERHHVPRLPWQPEEGEKTP
jgi:hypothetical protein